MIVDTEEIALLEFKMIFLKDKKDVKYLKKYINLLKAIAKGTNND